MSTTTPAAATEQIRTKLAVNLTVACAALGISQATGSRAITAGTFPVPVVRMGTRVIVPTEPLRKLLDDNQPAPVVEKTRTLADFSDDELLAEVRKRMRVATRASA